MNLQDFFSDRKLIVCVGTGGVGKTTSAAALGVGAAQMGKRVLVITVDPSQRLATTLGLKRNTSQATKVEDSTLSGTLHGVVVHPAEVFDRFLRETVSSGEEIERLLRNRLYHQLKTRLGESQEFTSLEILHQSVTSGAYDLVILDTPPAQNAIDFLNAPEKLHALFDSSVTKWFLKEKKESGIFKKIIMSGSEKVFESLQLLTGAEFLRELREFFQLAQGWQKQLSARMREVHKILGEPSTSFLLVTSFDEAKLIEATDFERELKRKGYRIDTLVVNKMFPSWFKNRDLESVESTEVGHLKKKMVDFFQLRRRHLEQFEKESSYQYVFRVPGMVDAVSDLDGLKDLLAAAEISGSSANGV